jgi:hypothetical protein
LKNKPSAFILLLMITSIGCAFATNLMPSNNASIEPSPQAANPLKVTIEFDKAPAAIDPSAIDPQNFDPGTIDPNNFDPSMFMSQPIQTEAVIGPQGGDISVTGSNGVTYTLSVPPDALRSEIPITLKPISGIPDLPLSGGLMAAVFIEPESLIFDIPARLTMTSSADFPASDAPLVIGFSFESEGREFHLYPFDVEGAQSNTGGHLAAVAASPNFMKYPDSWVNDGGGKGTGRGTAEDVNAIAKKTPSTSQDRMEQDLAVSQLEASSQKADAERAEIRNALEQEASQVNDLRKLVEALEDFRTFVEIGGNKITEKELDLLVDKAYDQLKNRKRDCLTEDDFKAQALIEQLINPQGSFSKALATRFKQKNSQFLDILSEDQAAQEVCSISLSMKSTLTFTAYGSTLTVTAQFNDMPLLFAYRKGEITFFGTRKMKLTYGVEGQGCSFPITQYANLDFNVHKLSPISTDGFITDFNLIDYSIHGWKKSAGGSATQNDNCPTSIALIGGGDYWTGLFTIARMSIPRIGMTGWDVKNNLATNNKLEAEWVSQVGSFTPVSAGGDATMSEDTIFKLTIIKNTR